MGKKLRITCPEAYLEVTELNLYHVFRYYEEPRYTLLNSSDKVWWQLTWEFAGDERVRLRAPINIREQDALWKILAHRERLPLPLPTLVILFFLASIGNGYVVNRHSLCEFVDTGVGYLLRLLPPQLPIVSGIALSPESLDQLTVSIMDALLHDEDSIAWPTHDGDGLRVVLHLVDYFWTFPPDVVRGYIDASGVTVDTENVTMIASVQDRDEQLAPYESKGHKGKSLLWSLSALRGWNFPLPSVRGLPIRSPLRDLPFAGEQALWIMHPDAPRISDDALSWLCEGTIGDQRERPMSKLLSVESNVERLGIPRTTFLARITTLHQEAASGIYTPSGQWVFQVSERLPVLIAVRIDSVRMVATSDGYWFRLIPTSGAWGIVLWWRPQERPPFCLAYAAIEDTWNIGVVALHATLWELWRNLCVIGDPDGHV